MADPVLKKNFSERGLNQAVAIASMCVQEEATARPLISDVMVALSFLSLPAQDGVPTAVPILSFRDKSMSIALSRHDSHCGDEEDDDSSRTSSASSEEEEESSENMKSSLSKKKMKQEDEGSAEESDDGSDSNSDDEHEKEQDVKKNAAQSLKIEYRYSWEDVNVNDERLSSKSSHKSIEESTSSRYESDGDHDEPVRNSNGKIENGVAEDKEEEEEEIRHELEHVHSSKSEDQSVYSDADSRDDNGGSLHRVESN